MVDQRLRSILVRLLIVAALALGLGALAACGGGDDDDDGEPTGAATTAPAGGETTPADGDGGPVDESFSVNQEFWHSGFHITLSDGRYYSEEDALTRDVTYFVEIDASFENLGPSETFFDGALALVAGGDSYSSTLGSDIPNVPSGLSSSGTLIFIVDEDFDAESAYLQVGAAGENQARVPLGAGGGELVDLAPSEPAVTGTISLELIDLNFTSAELRADRLSSYTEIDEGKLALTLNFDVISRKSGNWNIFANEFALVLPDGSGVAADGSELGSLPGSDIGTETGDLSLRFLVNDPPAGEYTLRFTPADYWFDETDPAEGTLTFELS